MRASAPSVSGGTNAHVVVEEPPRPGPPDRPGRRSSSCSRLAAEAALEAATARLRDHLAAHPDVDLADVAFTLRSGRREFAHRRAFVASGDGRGSWPCSAAAPARVLTRKVEAAAPESRSSSPARGRSTSAWAATLYRDEPVFRTVVDDCAEVLLPVLGRDLRELLFRTRATRPRRRGALRRTEITQPALFVTEYALAQLWGSWGVRPAAMIGHSVGEFVAAVLAGVMSLEDGLRLVALRGRLMGAQPEGAMLSVRLDAEVVARRLNGPGVALASDNAPGLCVVAGPHPRSRRSRPRSPLRVWPVGRSSRRTPSTLP